MAVLSAAEQELVEKVASTLVQRRLTVPAILFLESMKPLSFLGSQALYMLEPAVRAFVDRPEYPLVAGLLEDRDKIELLLQRIEHLEAEREAKGSDASVERK